MVLRIVYVVTFFEDNCFRIINITMHFDDILGCLRREEVFVRSDNGIQTTVWFFCVFQKMIVVCGNDMVRVQAEDYFINWIWFGRGVETLLDNCFIFVWRVLTIIILRYFPVLLLSEVCFLLTLVNWTFFRFAHAGLAFVIGKLFCKFFNKVVPGRKPRIF